MKNKCVFFPLICFMFALLGFSGWDDREKTYDTNSGYKKFPGHCLCQASAADKQALSGHNAYENINTPAQATGFFNKTHGVVITEEKRAVITYFDERSSGLAPPSAT